MGASADAFSGVKSAASLSKPVNVMRHTCTSPATTTGVPDTDGLNVMLVLAWSVRSDSLSVLSMVRSSDVPPKLTAPGPDRVYDGKSACSTSRAAGNVMDVVPSLARMYVRAT